MFIKLQSYYGPARISPAHIVAVMESDIPKGFGCKLVLSASANAPSGSFFVRESPDTIERLISEMFQAQNVQHYDEAARAMAPHLPHNRTPADA